MTPVPANLPQFSHDDVATTQTSTTDGAGDTTSDTSTDTYIDSGSSNYTFTVTGSGAAPHLHHRRGGQFDLRRHGRRLRDETAPATGENAGDRSHEHEHGSDIFTYHETGTIAADGTETPTAFTVDDQTDDIYDDWDKFKDTETASTENGTEKDASSDGGSGGEHLHFAGSPDSFSGYIEDHDNGTFGDDLIDNFAETPAPSNGETDAGTDYEHDVENGGANDFEHVDGTFANGAATVTGANAHDGGWDDFVDGGEQTAHEQEGADSSHDDATNADNGHTTFGDQESSADGATFQVASNDAVHDGFVDGDQGGDAGDDPYTESGQSSPDGTDIYNDHYGDTATGSDDSGETITGTVDAYGNFTPTYLKADSVIADGEIGGDGGGETVAVTDPGDAETDGTSTPTRRIRPTAARSTCSTTAAAARRR